MSSVAIDVSQDQLPEFCCRWKIAELSLFGSVLRKDFGPDSDVDVLVVFQEDAKWSLLDVVQAEIELGKLMGRPADLVERSVVEQSGNWIRRRSILNTSKTIYAR